MKTPLPRYGFCLRWLRRSLVAGAIYDLALAALLVAAPEVPERLLAVPRPGEDFYLWMLALLVALMAAVYLLAAYDPFSYYGNVVIAVGGRGAAGLVLLFAAWQSGLAGLYPLAAGDLVFALVHAVFWWPIRR